MSKAQSLLLLFLVILPAQVMAHDDPDRNVVFSSKAAYATFESRSGCIITQAEVNASESVQRLEGGGVSRDKFALITVNQFNDPNDASCAFLSRTMSETTSDFTFVFDSDDKRARATGSITLFDSSDFSFHDVTFDIVWRGDRVVRNTFPGEPGFTTTIFTSDAVARGFVREGTTNYTPRPSVSAQLSRTIVTTDR